MPPRDRRRGGENGGGRRLRPAEEDEVFEGSGVGVHGEWCDNGGKQKRQDFARLSFADNSFLKTFLANIFVIDLPFIF